MTPLVCCRVADLTFVPSVSVFDKCRTCGERVAYSPASAKLVKAGNDPMCYWCIGMWAEGKPVFVVVNAGQAEDARRAEEERLRASN